MYKRLCVKASVCKASVCKSVCVYKSLCKKLLCIKASAFVSKSVCVQKRLCVKRLCVKASMCKSFCVKNYTKDTMQTSVLYLSRYYSSCGNIRYFWLVSEESFWLCAYLDERDEAVQCASSALVGRAYSALENSMLAFFEEAIWNS